MEDGLERPVLKARGPCNEVGFLELDVQAQGAFIMRMHEAGFLLVNLDSSRFWSILEGFQIYV